MPAGGLRAARTAFAAQPKPVAILATTFAIELHDDAAHVHVAPARGSRPLHRPLRRHARRQQVEAGRVPGDVDIWSDHFPARLHAVPLDFGTCQYVGNVVHPAPTSATGHAPRKPAHRPHCSHFTLRKRPRCWPAFAMIESASSASVHRSRPDPRPEQSIGHEPALRSAPPIYARSSCRPPHVARQASSDRIQNLSSHPCDLSTLRAPNPCPDSP